MVMVGFTPADAERIAESVKRSEREPRNSPRFKRGRGGQDSLDGERFLNSSGEQAPLGALMRIVSAEAVEGFDTIYTIGKPNATFQRQYLVNIGFDVDDGQLGVGSFLSEADFFLAGGSPAVGDSYGATPSSWAATKNRYGFEVTGGTTGSGSTQRVTGRQRFADELIGKADSQIAKAGTGTFSIWWRNASTGAWEDSTLNITVTALAAIVPATPKYAIAGWRAGQWVAGPWECA